MVNLLLIGLAVFVLNIPFGYWRANVKRFSLEWLLAIHIPVIFVIALRLVSHLGFAWSTYAVLVTAFFIGQQLGSLVNKQLIRNCPQVSSCLVMDLYRCSGH